MTHADRTVGNIHVTALLDADFPAGPITDAFPDVPSDELLAAATVYPDVYAVGDEWQLPIRAWVVRHPGGLLLMDTGIGGAWSPSQTWAPEPGVLPAALEEIGIAPHEVDTVVISHAHDDHIGGVLAEDGAPMFTNARHVIQQADRDWLRDGAPPDADAAAGMRLLQPLIDTGILEVIGGDHRIGVALELHHLPGHTPGHQILRISSEGHRLILCADTWNHPSQFARPDWPSGADNDAPQAVASRRALLAELRSHPSTVIAPTHFAEPFGEVRLNADELASWHPLP